VIGDLIQPTHLIFILVVALIVLGPKRLPEVGKSLGKSLRDFRGAMSGIEEHMTGEPSAPPPAPVSVPDATPASLAPAVVASSTPVGVAAEPAPSEYAD
jgi:sec-independent protein translocase protein TatA